MRRIAAATAAASLAGAAALVGASPAAAAAGTFAAAGADELLATASANWLRVAASICAGGALPGFAAATVAGSTTRGTHPRPRSWVRAARAVSASNRPFSV